MPGIDVEGCGRVTVELPREKSRVRCPSRTRTITPGFQITEEGNALSGKRLDLHLARITSGNDRPVSMFFGMEHINSGLNYLKLHFMLNSLTL